MASVVASEHDQRSDRAANPRDVHRTVLLFGKTGNGKSTLGNVLVGTHRRKSPREVFKEGDFGGSETVDAKECIVHIDSKKYRIVDTVGIGGTGLDEEEVLVKLARTCNYLHYGINQILFVSSGRFTKEEQEAYDMLRQVLFNDDVCDYVTVVRTRSPFFENRDKCEEHNRIIRETSPHARDILDSAKKIIHVNNPSQDDTEHWVEVRDKSRSRVLAWLEMCGELYNPPNLVNINKNITKHLEKEQLLAKEIERVRKELEGKDKQHKTHVEKQKMDMEIHQETLDAATQQFQKASDAQKAELQNLKEQQKKAENETSAAMAKVKLENLERWMQQTKDGDVGKQRAQEEVERLKAVLEKHKAESKIPTVINAATQYDLSTILTAVFAFFLLIYSFFGGRRESQEKEFDAVP